MYALKGLWKIKGEIMKENLYEEEKIESLSEKEMNELISFINNSFILDDKDSTKVKNCKELTKYLSSNKIYINELTADILLANCPSLHEMAKYLSKHLELVKNNSIANIISVYEGLIEDENETEIKNGEETINTVNSYEKGNVKGDLNLLSMYLEELRFPLLTREEEVELSRRIKAGDRKAFDKLVNHNLKLVVKIANKYKNKGLPVLDLIQAGNEGLIKAAERFDGEKGYKFSTYATWWIKQTIVRTLGETSRNIRVPYYIYEELIKIKAITSQYQKEYGEEPSIEILADIMGKSVEKVRQYYKYLYDTVSLSTKVGDEGETELGEFIADENNDIEKSVTNELLRDKIEEVLNDENITERERKVIMYRYGLYDGKTYTLDEIGTKFNVTKERIRQIEGKALRKLRHPSRKKKLQGFL